MRDFYAVGIGGVGYFGTVHIVYTYGTSGSREVEHVYHGVRVEVESLLSSRLGYVGSEADIAAGSSWYVCIGIVVLHFPVFVDGILFSRGNYGSMIWIR